MALGAWKWPHFKERRGKELQDTGPPPATLPSHPTTLRLSHRHPKCPAGPGRGSGGPEVALSLSLTWAEPAEQDGQHQSLAGPRHGLNCCPRLA